MDDHNHDHYHDDLDGLDKIRSVLGMREALSGDDSMMDVDEDENDNAILIEELSLVEFGS